MKEPVSHRDLTGDHTLDALIMFYGIRGYRTPDYWPGSGLIVSESDLEVLRIHADPRPEWGPRASPFYGLPVFTAPDWTCEPDLVALARFVATLRRHRWYRRLERILERGGKRDA